MDAVNEVWGRRESRVIVEGRIDGLVVDCDAECVGRCVGWVTSEGLDVVLHHELELIESC